MTSVERGSEERVLVFSDVVGFTSLTERLGDQGMLPLIEAHKRLVARLTENHRGEQVEVRGDGFFLAFEAALPAARFCRDLLGVLETQVAAADGSGLRVRTGVHSGAVVRTADGFFGRDVILASRIAERAAPDEVLISEPMRRLLQGAREFSVGRRRRVALKGILLPQRIYPLLWTEPARPEDAAAAPQKDWNLVLERLRAGDRNAIAKVTRVITGFLARYRAYDLRDSWDDLAQDVLVALLNALRTGAIRDPQACVGFIGTVTRNKLADFLEQRRRPGSADALGEPEVAEESAYMLRDATTRDPDALIDLRRALAALAEKERQVVEALYIEGLRYEEAAARLGLPLGTLKRLQTEGLRSLRRSMDVKRRSARSDSA